MAEEEINQNKSQNNTTNAVAADDVEVKERGFFDFLKKKEPADEKPPQVKPPQVKPPQEEEVLVTEFDDKVKVSNHEPVSSVLKEEEDGEKKHSTLSEILHHDEPNETNLDDQDVENKEKCLQEILHTVPETKPDEEEDQHKHNTSELLHRPNITSPSDDRELEKSTYKQQQQQEEENIVIPVEKAEVDSPHPHHHHEAAAADQQEKKGFLDKIKDKLPGHHKKTEEKEEVVTVVPSSQHETSSYNSTADHDYEGDQATKEKKGFMEKIKDKLPGHHHTPAAKTTTDQEINKSSDDHTHH